MSFSKSTEFSVFQKIRAADAKEVEVENPAEETYHRPNRGDARIYFGIVNCVSLNIEQAKSVQGPYSGVIELRPPS